jgi:hypothetical protein
LTNPNKENGFEQRETPKISETSDKEAKLCVSNERF